MAEPPLIQDLKYLDISLQELWEKLDTHVASHIVLETLRTPERHAWMMLRGYTKKRALHLSRGHTRGHKKVLEVLQSIPDSEFRPLEPAVVHSGYSDHFPDMLGKVNAVSLALVFDSGDVDWDITHYMGFRRAAMKVKQEIETKHRVSIENMGPVTGQWLDWVIVGRSPTHNLVL